MTLPELRAFVQAWSAYSSFGASQPPTDCGEYFFPKDEIPISEFVRKAIPDDDYFVKNTRYLTETMTNWRYDQARNAPTEIPHQPYLGDELPEEQFQPLFLYLNITKLHEITKSDLRKFLKFKRTYNVDTLNLVREHERKPRQYRPSELDSILIQARIDEAMPTYEYISVHVEDISAEIDEWRLRRALGVSEPLEIEDWFFCS